MQGAQEPGIDDAEGKHTCANAKGENQDAGSRETGRFAQHAQTKVQIPNEILNPIQTLSVAAFLFGLLDAAEVYSRPPPRFLGCHPFCDVFLGCPVEVVEQLVIQFLVHLRPAKQRPQPHWNREQPMLRSHSPTLLY
jgi:hypothetical protein